MKLLLFFPLPFRPLGCISQTQTEIKNRLPQAKIPLLDRQAYLELKRAGNNINQIARHYNSRITVPDHRLKTFDILSGKLDSIIKALIDDR